MADKENVNPDEPCVEDEVGKFSKKDKELVMENLEGIPVERMWSPEQLKAIRRGESVSTEIAVAIHPDLHVSDTESGAMSGAETESVSSEFDLEKSDKLLVVSPTGKKTKRVDGKLAIPHNYLKKNVTVVTMKKKAAINAIKSASSKGPKYRCELKDCNFSCGLKKEFTAHMKSCHAGVHYEEGKRNRICIAEMAKGVVKPQFLLDKNNRLQSWVEKNATLVNVSGGDKVKKTPTKKALVTSKAGVSQPISIRKKAAANKKTVSQPLPLVTPQISQESQESVTSQDWQAPIGNRNGTPIPPGILGQPPTPTPNPFTTPKRKVDTRYLGVDDSILAGVEGKKDKVESEKEKNEVQSDNLSDLSVLSVNRSLNLLDNVQTSTLRPGEAQRMLDYSGDNLDDTVRRTQTQTQSQDEVAASDLDMIEKDQLRAKVMSLEEALAVAESRNAELDEEVVMLQYWKMRAQDCLDKRKNIIELMEKNLPVPESLSQEAQVQDEEMARENQGTQTGPVRMKNAGTQSDIGKQLMDKLVWMEKDEEDRIKDVTNLKLKLARAETMNTKYHDSIKTHKQEIQQVNAIKNEIEKSRNDLHKRVEQDAEMLHALSASMRGLEMVNQTQAHQLKTMASRVPCRKADCKDPKKCGNSHEYKDAAFKPKEKTLCSFFLKGHCHKGKRCNFLHEQTKHPLDGVRDKVLQIQNGQVSEIEIEFEQVDSQDEPVQVEEENRGDEVMMEQDETNQGGNELELDEVSQQPLPEADAEEEKVEQEKDNGAIPKQRGVNTTQRPVRSRGRGRGEVERRPSSTEVRRMQAGRGVQPSVSRPSEWGGRGFNHSKALKTQEFYVNNIKNRGRSREKAPSPSPRKGQRNKSRGSSSASFVSAKSRLSSRSSSSRRLGDEKRPSSNPRRVPPPRPRTGRSGSRIAPPRPRSGSRPRSTDDRRRFVIDSPRLPKRSPSDKEIGKWVRQSLRDEMNMLPRVPRMVASEEDMRYMSSDGLDYLQDRLVRMSQNQAGNANGPRVTPTSGLSSYRGTMEELRERAMDRYNVRTSNRVHSAETSNMAGGLMRENIERSLFRRRRY